jgi:hypothetical protein
MTRQAINKKNEEAIAALRAESDRDMSDLFVKVRSGAISLAEYKEEEEKLKKLLEEGLKRCHDFWEWELGGGDKDTDGQEEVEASKEAEPKAGVSKDGAEEVVEVSRENEKGTQGVEDANREGVRVSSSIFVIFELALIIFEVRSMQGEFGSPVLLVCGGEEVFEVPEG